MRMSRARWLGLFLGVVAFVAAFGVALAVVVQVSREVPSTVSLGTAVVLPDENLALWHDAERTQPVTSLEFNGVQLQPPLDGFSPPESPRVDIYIENLSDIELSLIAPCDSVHTPDGDRIGFIGAEHFDPVTREFLFSACQGTFVLAPGQMLQAVIEIHAIDPGIPPGEYSFTTVFGAIGEGEVPEPGLALVGDNFDLSSGATTERRSPGVAYSSRNIEYLVVWHDRRNPGNASDIFGQRVADGRPQGGNFPIMEFADAQIDPAVAFDPVFNQYLVAWRTQQAGAFNAARGRVLASDGAPVGDDFGILTGGHEIAIGFGNVDNRYLVTSRGDGILSVPLFSVGSPGPGLLISESGAPNGGLAYNPGTSEFLVTWRDQTANNLKGQLISGAGAAVGGLFVITPEFPESGRAAGVAFDPTNDRYLVVYAVFQANNVKGQFVGADGALIGEPFEITSDLATRVDPAVAYSAMDEAYLVVFRDENLIRGELVLASGEAVGPHLVIADSPSNDDPAIAYNSQTGEFLVVWTDDRNLGAGEQDIFGQIVDIVQ